MTIEGFTCKKTPEPVAKWIQEKDEKVCHPCLLKPLASYYLGELEKAGAKPQIVKLEKAWDTADVLTIAQAMDSIKTEVGDDLKNALVALDCFTQSYVDEATTDQQQQ